MSYGRACIRRHRHSVDDGDSVTALPAQASSSGSSQDISKATQSSGPASATSEFSARLDLLAQEIDRRTTGDVIASGRFARAYVDLILAERSGVGSGSAVDLSRTMMKEPQLYALWSDWLMQCLTRHVDVRHSSQLSMIHHAAVGLWLGVFMADAAHVGDEDELRRRMLRLLPW